MSIIDLAHVIAADIRDQITWFQGKHLLSVNPSCVSCNTCMDIQERRDIQDKYRYASRKAIFLCT